MPERGTYTSSHRNMALAGGGLAGLALVGAALFYENDRISEMMLPDDCPATTASGNFTLHSLSMPDSTCHLEAMGANPDNTIVVDGLKAKDSTEWTSVHDYSSAFTAALNAVATDAGVTVTMNYEGKEVELRKDTNGQFTARMTIHSPCRCDEPYVANETYSEYKVALREFPDFIKTENRYYASQDCQEGTSGQAPFKVAFEIISRIGSLRDGGTRIHQGYDIVGEGEHPNIYPTLDGTVIAAGPTKGRAGKRVKIKHNFIQNLGSCTTLYAHLNEISVTEGQFVTWNTPLGTQGKTGNAQSDHLHMELHCSDIDTGSTRIYPPNMLWEVGGGGPPLSCEAQRGSVYIDQKETDQRLGFTKDQLNSIKNSFTIEVQSRETEKENKKEVLTQVVWKLTKKSAQTVLPPLTIQFFNDGITLTWTDPSTGLETREYSTSEEAVAGILALGT